jgi:hypothetical protein
VYADEWSTDAYFEKGRLGICVVRWVMMLLLLLLLERTLMDEFMVVVVMVL